MKHVVLVMALAIPLSAKAENSVELNYSHYHDGYSTAKYYGTKATPESQGYLALLDIHKLLVEAGLSTDADADLGVDAHLDNDDIKIRTFLYERDGKVAVKIGVPISTKSAFFASSVIGINGKPAKYLFNLLKQHGVLNNDGLDPATNRYEFGALYCTSRHYPEVREYHHGCSVILK